MTAPSERKLTYKEYVARAMLIPNAGYAHLHHMIIISDQNNTVRYLDPDTLEELSLDKIANRYQNIDSYRQEIAAWVDADGAQLSVEEHRARAMLMGMFYGDKTHVYFPEDRNSGIRLDADTLKHITKAEVYRRMEAYNTLRGNLDKIRGEWF